MGMTISNKAYDILKFIALVLLPAVASLYLGLGELWEWPETDKVVASIVLVDTFLGVLLQLNTVKYRNDVSRMDGYLAANGSDPDTGIPNLKLVITTSPEELLSSKTATLKIGQPPEH